MSEWSALVLSMSFSTAVCVLADSVSGDRSQVSEWNFSDFPSPEPCFLNFLAVRVNRVWQTLVDRWKPQFHTELLS